MDSPFAPQNMPAPDQGQPLVDRWKSFLTDPNNQAAMMSFGASLATPMGFGATPMGHVAQAMGHAGKTISNRHESDRKDFEADSRATAREQAAETATARSQIAAANADTAATRAAATGANVASQIERREVQNQLDQTRAEKIDSDIRFLEQRIALFPDDQDAKRKLMLAQADRARAQGGVVQMDADTRRQNADTSRQNADTRARSQQDRTTLRTQELEQRGDIARGRLESQDASTYERYRKGVEERNSNILRDPKAPKEKLLSLQEWQAMRGGARSGSAPGAPQGPQTPQRTPSQPQYTQPATNVRVPQQAIEALRKDPSLAPDFDAKYGLGLSETYLGRSM